MLDYFAEAMIKIDDEINKDAEKLYQAPFTTPVRRLDEVAAARNLNINYFYSNK
jgi:glycine dehydrogenase subunit 2